MVEVTVDASWRLSRAEILAPHSPTGTINGSGEVLILNPLGKRSVFGKTVNDNPVTVPVAVVTRVLGEVMEDFVEVDGGRQIKFGSLLEALSMFFDKWRIEDADLPPRAQAAAFVEMQPPIPTPPKNDELPPPISPVNTEPPEINPLFRG